SRLHRKVELGTVSVGFFSGLGVDDFKISERPDFQAGTFVSSDHFAVRINWPALLLKKIVIHSVELKKPNVTIIREPDGVTYNFSDLMAGASTNGAPAPAASTPPPSSSGSAFSVLVVKAILTDGKLDFLDRSPKRQSIKVSDLNFTFRN